MLRWCFDCNLVYLKLLRNFRFVGKKAINLKEIIVKFMNMAEFTFSKFAYPINANLNKDFITCLNCENSFIISVHYYFHVLSSLSDLILHDHFHLQVPLFVLTRKQFRIISHRLLLIIICKCHPPIHI